MSKLFKIILIFYCFLCLIYGIHRTHRILMSDILTHNQEYGRVELLASYWYEYYYPNKLLKWYKETYNKQIMIGYIDKAATPIYIRKYNIPIVSVGDYMITAYKTRVDSILEINKLNKLEIELDIVNKSIQWQNIYKLKEIK